MSYRPEIIYIASIGRSGTTLLDSMLGAHSQIVTVGEFEIWPHEIRLGGRRPCGCGENVLRCPFWTAVRRRADPLTQPEPRLDHFREHHHAGRTLRPARLTDFSDAPLDAPTRAQIHRYGLNNRALYRAVLDVTEETTGTRPRWIADSSKDVYRLAWLLRSDLFRIKVLHLVKNPRGFIYSVTRPWLESTDPLRAVKRWYYTGRQSTAWVIRNHLVSTLAMRHLAPGDHLVLRYEDLASRPHDAFRRVCDLVGVPYEAEAVDGFRAGSRHTIAGNPMRYERRGIELDERWRRHLPAGSRRLADVVTTGTRARFGY